VFRDFENDRVKKIWHNYGFDRHVLEGLGFKMAGFAGDRCTWPASTTQQEGVRGLQPGELERRHEVRGLLPLRGN